MTTTISAKRTVVSVGKDKQWERNIENEAPAQTQTHCKCTFIKRSEAPVDKDVSLLTWKEVSIGFGPLFFSLLLDLFERISSTGTKRGCSTRALVGHAYLDFGLGFLEDTISYCTWEQTRDNGTGTHGNGHNLVLTIANQVNVGQKDDTRPDKDSGNG